MRHLGRGLLLLLANLAVFALCEGAYRGWISLTTPRPDAGVERFDLYAVGESTMVGEPFEPKISVPRLLEHLFAGRVAGRPIALRNVAERAVPLYPQALAFERAMATRDDRAPGVVLIMSGHNEGIRPGTVAADGDDGRVPDLLIEKSVLVRDMLLALRRRRIVPRAQTLAAYEHYLRRVIELAHRNGLVPVVATMASNITRVEPNFDGDAEAVRQVVEHGLALEDQGRHADARDAYVRAVRQLDDGEPRSFYPAALLYYRAGRCEEALGNFAAAHEHYWKAVDRDPRTSFGRATRAQNEIVRRLAREYDVPLVDAVAVFAHHSPHGIPAPELFADGQHPSIAGYLLLANAFADVIARRFETPVVHPLHDADAVSAALGFTDEDLRGALIDAGSWLIATSVDHPLPRDRMVLARAVFHAAMGKGDDFSAWFGLGLVQAAQRGGLRRSDEISRGCHYTKSYAFSPQDVARMADRLQALGVDAEIVRQVRVLGRAADSRSEGNTASGPG